MVDPDAGREYTSIDVDEFGTAVDDLDATLTGLTDHISGLESDFDYFGVDKSNFNKLLEAKTDLEDIMPDMRRRHSLAVQLLAEQQSAGWAGDGTVRFEGTDILNDDFDSITDARNAGSDLADQVNEGDGEIPPEVYEELEEYGHDPDFAEAFINGLSPASRGLLVMDADNQAEGGGGDDPDDGPQLAVAEVFATASFRIDYDEKFFEDIGDGLRDMDLPGPGIAHMDAFIPLMQHGTWSHESLTSVADAAFSGDPNVTGHYSGDWRSGVWSGLARNPRASAEFMAEHQDEMWDTARYGDYESQEAYADFVRAATVEAGPIYDRLRLYDEDLPNLAEQNAAFLIEQVGSQKAGEEWEFNEHMRTVFVDITEEYWDDFMYSFSSPAGVSDNPNRDGIEIDPAHWDAFITEGMRTPEGSARMYELYFNQVEDMRDARDGDADASGWDGYIIGRLRNNFLGNYNQVLQELEASEAEAKEFRDGVIDYLIGAAFDPRGAAEAIAGKPKEVAQEILGNLLKGWADQLTEEETERLNTDEFGDYYAWEDNARDRYEDGEIEPYDDGTVTWDGDTGFYEELYGGRFTDDSGNLLDKDEFKDDPEALAAYNAWLQDPAVQRANSPFFEDEVHSSGGE